MTDFEQVCRANGIRLTPQRRVVLAALAGSVDHPTADDLFEEVRVDLPDISRTTVYRVLETLVGLGLARTVSHPGSAARYEAAGDRHAHLMCQRCQRLIDVMAPEIESIPWPSTRRLGFRINGLSVQFTGLCSACQA